MKPKLIYIFMTCIVIGMVLLLSSFSPDNNKKDKSKVENLCPPPSPWTVSIVVSDPYDSCAAYNQYSGCSLEFLIEAATEHCVGILATPSITKPINWGQRTYTQSIPDTIPCVQVTIQVVPPSGCSYPFNTSPCCKCKGDSNPCVFKICP